MRVSDQTAAYPRKIWPLPLGSKHCPAVSLRPTNSPGGGPINATMRARCLNGSCPPSLSNISANRCCPSKRSQICIMVSTAIGNDRRTCRSYQTCQVPNIDSAVPRHFENYLWRSVDEGLNEWPRLLCLSNTRFAKVAQNRKPVAFAFSQWTESSALVNSA